MKKWLIILGMALLLYGGYAKHQFSRSSVEKWLLGQQAQMMSGGDHACESFADDVKVSLLAQTPQGHWEVEGGKEELCAYLKQSTAAMTVLQAQTESRFSDIHILRRGFPWTTAEVSYIEHSTLSAGNTPKIYNKSVDKITLKRTLGGMKITEITSKSQTGWYPIP